ncbi:CBO0543 family protein [Salinibacillus xinjiangensis]|uniref:Uncharacterized protein n=1 Tax=Salinibacillus xinjiangensis TaxID=1229268 RepID=A0A6G1X864_9BACI|nr:CBO0543 family protein [Salinibacillus xinjiangensis]MRG87132.1 hypothetical protein [Salinibacillus xinjiangensis]
MDKFDYLEKVHRLEQQAAHLDQEGWLRFEVFTPEWWILVSFLIFPWILWYKFAIKDKLLESLFVGTLVIIPTTYLDVIGLVFEFWVYPTQLVPISPRAIPFDMSMVPVAFMFIFQYFTSWKSYSIALVLMSTLFAFVGEPISSRLELVSYINWHYVYSFFYYLVIGFGVRTIVLKVKKLSLSGS